jgi:hypothetical protein
MNTRGWAPLLAVGCGLLLGGCGIGVGQGFARSTMGPQSSTFSETPTTQQTRVGFARINTVTLYDTTGILLAALGTAGNAHNARMEAQDRAVRSGAQAGDTYSYSYQVVPPAAGTKTSMTLGWGSAASGSIGSLDFNEGGVSYFLLDLRSSFVFWDLAPNMELGLFLGVLWESWSGNTPAGEIDSTWIGMPLGLSLNYSFLPMLSVSPRFAIDPLLGPLGLLSEGGHWLWLEAGARLDFRPIEWLLVSLDVMHRVTPWELGNSTGTSTQFNLGVAYMFTGF